MWENVRTRVVNLLEPGFEQSRETICCKFVLLSHLDELLFIVGAIERYAYHAELIEAYGKTIGLARHWVRHSDQLQIDDPAHLILGGGYLDLDAMGRRIRLYGSSKAYGYYDLSAAQHVSKSSSFFVGFSVAID